MAIFDGAELTRLGDNLFARGIAEAVPLRILRIAVGNGELPPTTDPYNMTQLINELYTVPIVTAKIISDNIAQLEFKVDSSVIRESFIFREIGIFADNGHGGELLYAYDNCGDKYDTIPAAELATYIERRCRILVRIANADKTRIIITRPALDMNLKNIGEPGAGAGLFSRLDDDGLTFLLKRITGSGGIKITETGDLIDISIAP